MTHRARAAAWTAGLVALTVAGLMMFGRPWWCSVGDAVPWSWDTSSAHNSQHILDPYSFTHFEHGILYFALLALVARRQPLWVRFVAAIGFACGWELLENSSWIIERYREQTIDAGYYGDSILNAVADVGWCALGFWFTARVRWWWPVAVIIAIEVGLALTIRDNLLLNILMLIHSFDFILDWQARRAA